MIIIIPAYEPDEKLIKLVSDLKSKCNFKLLIIDDGSGEKYESIFDKASNLGASVYHHNENKGKGAALKTAFSIIKNFDDAEEIITADCDGQHTPMDIIKIAQCIKNNKNKLILGVRYFTGKVPFRSILGNKLTSRIFELINGKKISDTQTGLRGFSKSMIPWLCSIKGNGYEYEMNMLLESEKYGYGIKEVPIETVYIENNTSSHFNPLIDSLRIYFQILKYSMSSILSGILDFIFLLIIKALTSNLLISVVIARFLSSSFNYVMNKNYVFSRNKEEFNTTLSLPRYIFLVITVLIFNYIILDYLCSLGVSLVIAKLLTECTLFIFSFVVQKRFVFK